MRLPAIIAALAGLALLPVAADAHVQVTPAEVAPADPVLFTVLVPNERDVPTTRVALKLPARLVPFSFEEVPGWKREDQPAADGSVETVVWTGELPPSSFVRFSFLASTPDQPGTLTFPTVQTYADGTEAAWVGPPSSDEPAPTVEVSQSAPASNAGGEGQEAPTASTEAAGTTENAPATSALAEPTTTQAAAAPAVVTVNDDDSSTVAWTALALGGAGLLAGLAALGVVLRRRSSGGAGPEAW
jgi:uncharacterized protein YcnI